MKLTRHNGRSGKHGTYNPRHNDRRFDVENSEHIDAERARQNVYWDCYRGFTTHDFRDNPEQPDFSFEEIERMYYYEHYADHVNAQNARNEKTRHIERNRTVDDLLKNNKTCPEESIYQIGTIEESVSPETLALIVSEFYEEFERRFGSHIHILDWALHLDEGTPHIHERHVFDCENRYGELCPQQEKALEELGIPLPKPEQPKGKHNNRKQTFDAVCRTILIDIAKRHGLHATFMPKPRREVNGSAMHIHFSLFKNGKNIFVDPEDPTRLSEEAYYFIGGLLAHSREMTLITNPLVNSYKRLVPGFDAPTELTWTRNNQNSLVRIPGSRGMETRIELRSPDAAANPYLVFAVCLAAGLDGINKKIYPTKSSSRELSETDQKTMKIENLPGNLNEAIDYFEQSDWIKEVLGTEFCKEYAAAKKKEWLRYTREISAWEIEEYLYRI